MDPHLGKQLQFFKKLSTELAYDPEIPIPNLREVGMYVHKKTYTQMLIVIHED